MQETSAQGEATYFRPGEGRALAALMDEEIPECTENPELVMPGPCCLEMALCSFGLDDCDSPLLQSLKPVINGGLWGFESYAIVLWSPGKPVPI